MSFKSPCYISSISLAKLLSNTHNTQWRRNLLFIGKPGISGSLPTCTFLNLTLEMFKFFCKRRYLILSFGGPQLYNCKALPFTNGQYVVIELADKLYNSVTGFFCKCFVKTCLSHRSHAGTEHRLGALQHSLWPDVCTNRLAKSQKSK